MTAEPNYSPGSVFEESPHWRSPQNPLTPSAFSNESGTTMVEMSIVMMLLLTLFMGILEFGMAFRDHLSVSNTARDAARTLAAKGNDPDADCLTLVRIGQSTTIAGSMDNLEQVEIFKANKDGSQNLARTNVYRFVGPDITDCGDWTMIQEGYPSTGRQILFGPTAELDIVGVRLIYRHDWATNFLFFSGSFEIDVSNIARIEPEAFE